MKLLLILIHLIFYLTSQGPETVYNEEGYIDVRNNKRHLYYQQFESRNSPNNDPVILWMTGGPGCSGMLALFVENGPQHVDSNMKLTINKYSWNNNANVIWIDQPVGSGFSQSDNFLDAVTSEKEMAEDVYEFLNKFFTKHTTRYKNDFYIIGESYGGHQVPSLGNFIYESNKNNTFKINLKGIGIGNGLVDPLTQQPEQSEYLKDNKIINNIEYSAMKLALPACITLIKSCKDSLIGTLACDAAVEVCNLSQVMPLLLLTGKNNYDVRKQCINLPLCYDFSNIENYLNNKNVIKQINALKNSWESCNHYTNLALTLSGDWMKSTEQYVKNLLANNQKVLIYSGEYDFICNWYGGYNWVKNMPWKGNDRFNKLDFSEYILNNKTIGSKKEVDNLMFIKFYNAGHMVPMDQPENALLMINNFIKKVDLIKRHKNYKKQNI